MKAIVFDRFGGTEVLHESDIEIPEPGAGQVGVRVKAAGVNALDGKVRSGAMQAAFPTPLPAVPGYELAGVVDAAGEGVTDVQVGDEVVGWADTGSYAEYALATTVARKPSGLDWEDAVALPIAGATSERRDRAHARRGRRSGNHRGPARHSPRSACHRHLRPRQSGLPHIARRYGDAVRRGLGGAGPGAGP